MLAPGAATQALLALHAALNEALERLGLSTEARRYRPHVTLARHAANSAAPAQTTPLHWPVRGYALMESQQATRDYIVLEHFGD